MRAIRPCAASVREPPFSSRLAVWSCWLEAERLAAGPASAYSAERSGRSEPKAVRLHARLQTSAGAAVPSEGCMLHTCLPRCRWTWLSLQVQGRPGTCASSHQLLEMLEPVAQAKSKLVTRSWANYQALVRPTTTSRQLPRGKRS